MITSEFYITSQFFVLYFTLFFTLYFRNHRVTIFSQKFQNINKVRAFIPNDIPFL